MRIAVVEYQYANYRGTIEVMYQKMIATMKLLQRQRVSSKNT